MRTVSKRNQHGIVGVFNRFFGVYAKERAELDRIQYGFGFAYQISDRGKFTFFALGRNDSGIICVAVIYEISAVRTVRKRNEHFVFRFFRVGSCFNVKESTEFDSVKDFFGIGNKGSERDKFFTVYGHNFPAYEFVINAKRTVSKGNKERVFIVFCFFFSGNTKERTKAHVADYFDRVCVFVHECAEL